MRGRGGCTEREDVRGRSGGGGEEGEGREGGILKIMFNFITISSYPHSETPSGVKYPVYPKSFIR